MLRPDLHRKMSQSSTIRFMGLFDVGAPVDHMNYVDQPSHPTGGGWVRKEFERANVRRFSRAIADAEAAVAALPPHRQEELARQFQEAADQALRHARYVRGRDG